MNPEFQCCAGSVPGRDHRLAGKNNQDAWHLIRNDGLVIAVVCDGCGSNPYSELGARLGASIVARWAAEHLSVQAANLATLSCAHKVLAEVRTDALRDLAQAVRLLDGTDKRNIEEYFMFTTLLVAILPTTSLFASIGDGVMFANGARIGLGPYPNNQPPYIGYGLLPGHELWRIERSSWTIQRLMETSDLESFLIGSDGLDDLINNAGNTFPGTERLIGPINSFWTDDRFFSNWDHARRQLALANKDVPLIDWETRELSWDNGRLKDDTTLIAGRRIH